MHVILFYKYSKLSNDWKVMELYKNAMTNLCQNLHLQGRVLIGVSENEGINGTLASLEEVDVLAYTYALLGEEYCSQHEIRGVDLSSSDDERGIAIQKYWTECLEFSNVAEVPLLTMEGPEDFKWSQVDTEEDLFPDLQIKLVEEIIGTGGVHATIPIQDTSKGYLTPEEWHDEMKRLSEDPNACHDTVLIDCRNHKEFEIGHFDRAIDPNTKTFQQFPKWVQENKSILKGKKVLMYCTGGIRCEKASAHIRKEIGSVADDSNVFHLKGGIHKYLDKYGSDGYFFGKNFVFDRRIGVNAEDHRQELIQDCHRNCIVGKCLYCNKNYDQMKADGICTVCREIMLVCDDCREDLKGEYHCADHFHLRHCYFTNLSIFSSDELLTQLSGLEKAFEPISVGKRYKAKRKTIMKQITKVKNRLDNLLSGKQENGSVTICRSCGNDDCNGFCWGVHGLKRKQVLESSNNTQDDKPLKCSRINANQRIGKMMQKEKDIAEMVCLGLSKPPSAHLYRDTTIRVPSPCVRVLRSTVKGKWCGKSVREVLSTEFHDLSDISRLNDHFQRSLIHVNDIPVNSEAALQRGIDFSKAVSPDLILKNMDVISRVVCWHEAPVLLKSRSINVVVHTLPEKVIDYLNASDASDYTIYCCDKPSSVPVHPTGPYLQNSLTVMVEAERGLKPRSLLPCHRLDRCTSGLTLCCTNPAVARLIQTQMDNKKVQKLYIARVSGKFPTSNSELDMVRSIFPKFLKVLWNDVNHSITVDAPIIVQDVQKGTRKLSEFGKASESTFQIISYDCSTNRSLVLCSPHTGRQHQLRVHLKALGFPICNDLLYGGIQHDSASLSKELVVLAIRSSTSASTPPYFEKILSTQMVTDAKEICPCCHGTPEIAFNDSQLLMGGSRIDLHAFCYKIDFDKDGSTFGSLECKVDLPPWASGLDKSYVPSWI